MFTSQWVQLWKRKTGAFTWDTGQLRIIFTHSLHSSRSYPVTVKQSWNLMLKLKRKARFGTTWWVYIPVLVCTERWTIIKEFVKITWNHTQTLHWQAQASVAWNVIHQIPSEYKIWGILKGASDDSFSGHIRTACFLHQQICAEYE